MIVFILSWLSNIPFISISESIFENVWLIWPLHPSVIFFWGFMLIYDDDRSSFERFINEHLR